MVLGAFTYLYSHNFHSADISSVLVLFILPQQGSEGQTRRLRNLPEVTEFVSDGVQIPTVQSPLKLCLPLGNKLMSYHLFPLQSEN